MEFSLFPSCVIFKYHVCTQYISGDATLDPKLVKKVIITSGKHYYSLLDKRESLKIKDVALIRMECFSPFPTMELQQELSKFPNVQGSLSL